MADKFISVNASGDLAEIEATVTSAGAGNAGDVVALDGTGRLDNSVMPVGIGAETKSLVTSESLAAGDLVNIWDDTGTEKARKADASAASGGKRAHGFVLSAVTAPAAATVYLEGTITGLTALTRGDEYFLDSTAGAATATPPTTSGYTLQRIGVAISATEITFEPSQIIIRA